MKLDEIKKLAERTIKPSTSGPARGVEAQLARAVLLLCAVVEELPKCDRRGCNRVATYVSQHYTKGCDEHIVQYRDDEVSYAAALRAIEDGAA